LKKPVEDTPGFVKGREAFQVIRIINVGMLRV